MKKIVLKTDIDCEKCKRKALQAIAAINGVDSVSIDLKEKKIIVIGEADPISLTRKMRKFRSTELLSVGPARNEMRLRHWTRTELLLPLVTIVKDCLLLVMTIQMLAPYVDFVYWPRHFFLGIDFFKQM